MAVMIANKAPANQSINNNDVQSSGLRNVALDQRWNLYIRQTGTSSQQVRRLNIIITIVKV